MADEPIVKLQSGGKASIVNYNVPERTSYPIHGLIEVTLPASRTRYFKDKYYATGQWKPATQNLTAAQISESVKKAFETNYFPNTMFPNMQLSQSALRPVQSAMLSNRSLTSLEPGSERLAVAERTFASPTQNNAGNLLSNLDPDVIADRIVNGEELVVYKNLYGSFRHKFIKAVTAARPRFYFVESYRLTSFLGDYGAGRTLKTFSLLPGENTTISVKTYKKSAVEQAMSSSVLDSYSEESASSFEDEVQTENSGKTTEEDSFSYYLDGQFEGGVDVGIASASTKIQSGFKGSSNSAREEFSKTITNASEKHSAKSSASRDVEINTSFEAKSEEGEEKATERVIENINVGRTLNFVFRQMNQEFISLYHLVDVRIGFTNGFRRSRNEVPIYKLDELLDTVLIDDEDMRSTAKETILGELRNVFDHRGIAQSILEERPLIGPDNQPSDDNTYMRVKTDMESEYEGKKVSGVILSASRNTMRTDGVIVEALLGQAEALDTYSKSLQEEAISAKHYKNLQSEARIAREKLAQKIVADGDAEAAEIFSKVFPAPQIVTGETESIVVETDDDG